MRFLSLRLMPLAALFCLMLIGQPALANGPFTVSGVHVEATASSATEARKAAINAGRAKAWMVLYRRLVRRSDWGRAPQVSPAELQRMVLSYYPESEKRSTTRYVATITFRFSKDAVERTLRTAGVSFASAPTDAVLLIPFAQGYAGASDWGAALNDPRYKDSFVPFQLPSGDAEDLKVLSGLRFAQASWTDLAPLAARYHVHEIVLAQALVSGKGVQVMLRHLNAESPVEMDPVAVPAVPAGGDIYAVAADVTVAELANLWKQHSVVDFSHKSTLTADVGISSLKGFAKLRRTLSGVPSVTWVAVDAMDVGMARITLSYMGSPDQLGARLARVGLRLAGGPGNWQIVSASTGAP